MEDEQRRSPAGVRGGVVMVTQSDGTLGVGQELDGEAKVVQVVGEEAEGLELLKGDALACRDPPQVPPVQMVVFFVGVVQQPGCKVLPPHGVHPSGELQELHLLHLCLQILHEPGDRLMKGGRRGEDRWETRRKTGVRRSKTTAGN